MIQYGFGLYDEGNKWSDKAFQNLNEVDKKFYHKDLHQLLIIIDISIITKKTIPVLINRLYLFKRDVFDILNKFTHKNYGINLTNYLPRFTGYRANVCTLSNGEYVAKYKKLLDERTGKFTKKIALQSVSRETILKERAILEPITT